jgi:hypothetical protein
MPNYLAGDPELADEEHTVYLLIASGIGNTLQNFNFTFTELRVTPPLLPASE